MEKKVKCVQADIYIRDIDLILEIHGPHHYKNGTTEEMDSALYTDKIYRKFHKHFIAVPYEYYNIFLDYGMDEDIDKGSAFLKKFITAELEK